MSDLNIGEVYATAPEFTNIASYFEPLRLDIEWWDLEQTEQLYSFSSWNPRGIGVTNHIPVVEASVTPPGTSQHGSFYFKIWDTNRVIDINDIRKKNVIIMKAKKYQEDPFENLIYGFTTKSRIQRHKNQLYYLIYGVGSGALLNERYVNIRRSARMKSIDSDVPLFDDELMEIRKLFAEILTNKELYVVDDDRAIADQFNPPMDVSGLEQSIVDDTILSLNEPYVQASHTLNAMLDSVGADGGIGPDNKPYLTFPLSRTPAITLKSWDSIAEQGLDRSHNVAYFMDDFECELDWSQEAGFSNRILAKSRVTQGSSTSSTTGNYGGFENLINMDIAQRIPATPARFRDLSVIVSRVGEGTINPKTKTLDGRIVEDKNISPTGAVIAYFNIQLSTIPEDNPTPMFLTNLVEKRKPNPAAAHWLILYERGNPGIPDTINWYYNTNENLTGMIARRPWFSGAPWANDRNNNSGWEVTVNNPFDFAFSVLDNFTHIIVAEDVDSQARYGVVEDLIDVSWTSNTIAANKALGEILALRCMPKVTYSTAKVTIPGILYMPGLIIRMEDSLSGLTSSAGNMAEISTATYNFGGSGDTSLGALSCDLSLIGHYDFKLESEAIGTGTE